MSAHRYPAIETRHDRAMSADRYPTINRHHTAR